ncbi:restriction endonuclease [Peristeroidobacter soli]|uniref:restriction endonuclease n=1 Tax=Peristeroidobacter soli TaxID=2497877 RepID=UPI00158BABD5|nr:restriction endonuclease [Peristeroidobacter soli]
MAVAVAAYVLLAFVAPHFLAGHRYTASLGIVAKNNAAFLAGGLLFIGVLGLFRAHLIRRKFDDLSGIESLRRLTWREFESMVGEAFRRRGYQVQENAVDGPDGGVDVVLRKHGATFYVQCKQWKRAKVGVKPLRELQGVIAAGGAAGGFFVASGAYTNEAHDFARQCPIELIDGRALVEMIAATRAPAPASSKEAIPATRTEPVIRMTPDDPRCPACGGAMVQRKASRGTRAGQPFWGCRSYPRCRGVRPVAETA